MIAPDETTFEWVRGRPGAPADFEAAVERWRQLPTDDGASFDTEVEVDAGAISPMVTWGTNPGHGRRGHRHASPTRRRWTRRPTANRPNARSPTWAWRPARR